MTNGEVILERSEKVLDAGQIEEIDPVVLRLEAPCHLQHAEADEHPLVEQKRRGRRDQADRTGLIGPGPQDFPNRRLVPLQRRAAGLGPISGNSHTWCHTWPFAGRTGAACPNQQGSFVW